MGIKKVTRTEVDFSDIFWFAEEEPWKISWNESNDLFFHTILDYKSHNDFYLSDLEHDFATYTEEDKTKKIYRAMQIMIDFMKKNEVEEMRVFND